MHKVVRVMGLLLQEGQRLVYDSDDLAIELKQCNPKISRGENYLGLPYVMLDYPKFFGKEDQFAIRVFFWWGNFFSISLQAQGRFKDRLQEKLLQQLNWLNTHQFHLCIHSDPWRHEFTTDNLVPLENMQEAEIRQRMGEKEFVKISARIGVDQWEEVYPWFESLFSTLLNFAKD